jgi:hypothetical protein
MNGRGKRLTLGMMAAGFAVLLGFAIAYRKAILEHVEAWRFQIARKTALADPTAGTISIRGMEAYSGPALVFDPAEFGAWPYFTGTEWVDTADLVVILGASGFRIIEQRFPRRAYVVIRDERPRDFRAEFRSERSGSALRSADQRPKDEREEHAESRRPGE